MLDAAAHHAKTFLLLSGLSDLKEIGALLCRHGLSECKMHIGYRMGADAERVFEISPEECAALTEEGLYSVFIRNPHPESPAATCGLPDTAFLRDRVPMTKAEIRAVGLSKLGLKRDSVLFDVGSGTGSIAVEAARLSPDLRVYAIERKDEAVALLHRNIEKFGLYNIQVVPAYAPEGLADLPAPTHAFLGGTGGKMKEILQELMKMTDKIRIVATAVSFETLQELLQVKENPAAADYEIVSVAATRSRLLGHYNMLQAENPVWIASWTMQR